MPLHLLRPCVGISDVDQLRRVQAARWDGAPGTYPEPYATTRRAPTRAAELLDGGSLYWVIKGRIQARQRLLRLEPATGPEGHPVCLIRMDAEIVLTLPVPHRAFQGWRYLEPSKAPPDLLSVGAGAAEIPASLQAELRELGLL